MNIIVLIKQVPDPEGSRDAFIINAEENRVEPRGIPPVMSLFDENALEAAARIKDKDKDNTRITIVTMGKRISEAVMLKALAAGADRLVKIEGDEFDPRILDSYQTAAALALAVRKVEAYDLIVVGRQSADWNAGQVGVFIAETLGIPVITLARKIDLDSGNTILVERLIRNGYEIVRSPLPALVMVSNEVGELRYPTMIDRRNAKKKPVVAWHPQDIDFHGAQKAKVILRHLYKPETRHTQCEIIKGDTPAETGQKLGYKLRERKII